MKRSEINKALSELEAMCQKYSCYLPPFCSFTPEQWQQIGHEYDEVRDCMLGWDITDYGMGDFDKFGFSLITIRNGNRAMADKYPKVYAEKLLYLLDRHSLVDCHRRQGASEFMRMYLIQVQFSPQVAQAYLNAADLQPVVRLLQRHKQGWIIICSARQIPLKMDLRPGIKINLSLFVSFSENDTFPIHKVDVFAV